MSTPRLLPTTAASSIDYTSVLGVEQSPTPEPDAPIHVPGVDSVEEMCIDTTFAEATHDPMDISPNTTTPSYAPPSFDPLHGPYTEQLTESLARARIGSGGWNTNVWNPAPKTQQPQCQTAHEETS